VVINEQTDITTGCKFQYFHFFASSRYSFHVFDAQLFSVVPQRIESGLIVFCHILHEYLTFTLSCVFVQVVRFQDLRPLISLPKHDRL